ncbi:alpha/beta hydrolase [Nesterenkonia halobia]|uniref:Dienelactone hydrolase family protein n=1 Tax=Nesterenkonia halobia TaxID=37922 RepID=A0ABP6R6E9_9MICC
MNPEPVVVWSREPDERRDTHLVVLLHGYGSHEHDLLGLVPNLPEEFTYASLRGPQTAGPGYGWFALDPQDLSYDSAEVLQAAEDVWSWIESVQDQHLSVTLLGFSQGMAVATTLLRTRPHQLAAVVGLSGFVLDPGEDERVAAAVDDEALAAAQVPFFWGRDQEDPIIPAAAVDHTHRWATEHANLTKVLYAGAGHGVVPQEISHVGEFLTHMVLKPARTARR